MRCKHQANADSRHPALTPESWARCKHQPSSNAHLEARSAESSSPGAACSANASLSGGTGHQHSACRKPAQASSVSPASRLQPVPSAVLGDEGRPARRLPAPRLPQPRVRGVLPVSWGVTAAQEGRWCGTCRCAQGLLFHFHLSHPISTAVCHQRREN